MTSRHLARRDPLVCEVVDRHDGRGAVVSHVGERRTGVPIVQMNDIWAVPFDQRRHGPAETEEPVAVVLPPGAVRLEVRVCASHPGDRDQREGTHHRVAPAGDHSRADPVGDGEVERGRVHQRDAAVIRHHEVHVDPSAAQFGTEPGRRCGEATDGRDGRQLGGGEQDAHLGIVSRSSRFGQDHDRRVHCASGPALSAAMRSSRTSRRRLGAMVAAAALCTGRSVHGRPVRRHRAVVGDRRR